MATALLLGGTGFIGKTLSKFLADKGYKIRILSRSRSVDYETFQCDLLSDKIPIDAFKNVDLVVHLAGYAHDIKVNKDNASLYHELNVVTTKKLAKISLECGVKSFIFFSSIKAGGKPKKFHCANEDSISVPDGMYGKTKREAELFLLELSRKSKMRINIIRPSIVYGPDMKGNMSLMYSLVKKGIFPSLPPMKNVKSLIHVDDVARSVLFIESRKFNQEIFIITDGKKYSSREIYINMCIAANKKYSGIYFPYFLFSFVSHLSKGMKYRIEKIFNSECYCSEKIKNEGFEPLKTLKNINETDF